METEFSEEIEWIEASLFGILVFIAAYSTYYTFF
jgi:hypothetical protein